MYGNLLTTLVPDAICLVEYVDDKGIQTQRMVRVIREFTTKNGAGVKVFCFLRNAERSMYYDRFVFAVPLAKAPATCEERLVNMGINPVAAAQAWAATLPMANITFAVAG